MPPLITGLLASLPTVYPLRFIAETNCATTLFVTAMPAYTLTTRIWFDPDAPLYRTTADPAQANRPPSDCHRRTCSPPNAAGRRGRLAPLVAGRYSCDRQQHTLHSADPSHSSDQALPSGQETLPFEKRNLPSLRLQNHHLTMNHRTEPHAADKTPLNRITKMITKAASTHANWWGYYRQKD